MLPEVFTKVEAVDFIVAVDLCIAVGKTDDVYYSALVKRIPVSTALWNELNFCIVNFHHE